jgi:hypothetical protein
MTAMGQSGSRLFGPALLTNAAATKYTAPASTTVKIQNVHVFNGSGTAATFTMSIGADAAGTRVFDAISVPPNTPFDSYGPFYLAAGDTIQAFSGTTNVLTLTLDGTLSTP